MQMHLHDTNNGHTKLLQVQHGLSKQTAQAGASRGQYHVVDGFPQIHKVVFELLKLDIIWQVTCDEGYFIITVREPHRWKEIEGEVHHVVARNIKISK